VQALDVRNGPRTEERLTGLPADVILEKPVLRDQEGVPGGRPECALGQKAPIPGSTPQKLQEGLSKEIGEISMSI
jgi:hypothetical protein